MCQFFLPGKKVHFEQADLHILQDYKAKYLHGVRQNSIRHNIKNKAGTLPPHGYGTSDSDPNPVDFGQLLSDNSSARAQWPMTPTFHKILVFPNLILI